MGWGSGGTLRKSWDLKGKEWENRQGDLFTQVGIKDAHSMLLEKSIFFISKTPWKSRLGYCKSTEYKDFKFSLYPTVFEDRNYDLFFVVFC